MNFRILVKWVLISLLFVLVLFTLAFGYLKNYRIEYCRAYSSSDDYDRVWCLEEPLTKFIFER